MVVVLAKLRVDVATVQLAIVLWSQTLGLFCARHSGNGCDKDPLEVISRRLLVGTLDFVVQLEAPEPYKEVECLAWCKDFIGLSALSIAPTNKKKSYFVTFQFNWIVRSETISNRLKGSTFRKLP
jgi:hypothetical protein